MYIKILLLISFTALASGSRVSVITQTCEGSKLNLQCNEGYVLKILNANYGRTSLEICPNGGIRSAACFSVNAPHVMSYRCNGEKKCTIEASNAVFGDPCHGTHKYLEVETICVPVKKE